MCWAWGNEDKAFQNRVENKDLKILKDIKSDEEIKSKYFQIFYHVHPDCGDHGKNFPHTQFGFDSNVAEKISQLRETIYTIEYNYYSFLDEKGREFNELAQGSFKNMNAWPGEWTISEKESPDFDSRIKFYEIDLSKVKIGLWEKHGENGPLWEKHR